MNYELINEMIGLMDFDLIEAADEIPQQKKTTRMTAFAKPWMKWAVAAVLIVVIGVGTQVALNMMGVFKNDNIVAPSGGSDNSAVISPIDSSEDESSSEQSSEDSESQAHNGKSQYSSESPAQSGGEGTSGSSTETPDVSSGEPSGDLPDQPEGEFVKDNMPAVTYKINGEYKTFNYQNSTAVVDSGSSYVIDHYVCADGNAVSKYADAEGLLQYTNNNADMIPGIEKEITAEEAIDAAIIFVLNTDIEISGLETSSISFVYSDGIYSIVFVANMGDVEVCVDKTGRLKSLTVKKHTY